MDELPDISHYLKSPLVSLQARIYLLRNKLSEKDLNLVNSKISELVYRIELFEDYLLLTNGGKWKLDKFLVSDLINQIIDKWNKNNLIKVKCRGSYDGWIRMDTQRMDRAINCVLRQIVRSHELEDVWISLERKDLNLEISFGDGLLKGLDQSHIEMKYLMLVLGKMGGRIDSRGRILVEIK